MIERFLLVLLIIALGTLLLIALRRILIKIINHSIHDELMKEKLRNSRRNKTDISSDLNELERQSFDKLMSEFDKNMEMN